MNEIGYGCDDDADDYPDEHREKCNDRATYDIDQCEDCGGFLCKRCDADRLRTAKLDASLTSVTHAAMDCVARFYLESFAVRHPSTAPTAPLWGEQQTPEIEHWDTLSDVAMEAFHQFCKGANIDPLSVSLGAGHDCDKGGCDPARCLAGVKGIYSETFTEACHLFSED